MSHRLVKTVALIGLAIAISGCNPILRTHGYVPTANNKPQEVNPDTDTKATVLARLGNPSVKTTFDEDLVEDTWYYICLLYTSPSPRDQRGSRMPSSA